MAVMAVIDHHVDTRTAPHRTAPTLNLGLVLDAPACGPNAKSDGVRVRAPLRGLAW